MLTHARSAVMHLQLGAMCLASSWTQTLFTYVSFMFDYIKDAVRSAINGNIIVRHGHSDCADYIVANVKDGVAVVKYTNGSIYKYTNVSRRALMNLVANANISVGRWINANLLFNQCKSAQFGTCTQML